MDSGLGRWPIKMGLPAVSSTVDFFSRSYYTKRSPAGTSSLGGSAASKRAYVVVFAQFGLIALFIHGLSAEYRSNAYQQDWIARNAPLLQYFLNGYLAAMLLGVFIGGGVLLAADYLRSRNKKSSLRTVG